MKALIVEDEAIASRRLKRMLEKENIIVIGVCESNTELQNFLSNNNESLLIFMDIHLSDGLVFETLNQTKIDNPIIFTTAYDQYAIKAFKQNAIDYLLKPFQQAELQKAIEKYNKHQGKASNTDLSALQELLTPKSYKQRFLIKVGDHLKTINIEDIVLFYSESKINYLSTKEGRNYPIDESLEQISDTINPNIYFKVNRTFIVNINFISDIVVYSNSRLKIVMNNTKHEIIVAREKVKAFKEWLE